MADDDPELAAAIALSLEAPLRQAQDAPLRQAQDAFTRGQALERSGELTAALECYEQSSALAERLEGVSKRTKIMARSAAIGSIGNVCAALGQCERAERYLNEAIAMCYELEDFDRLSWHLGNLGNLYLTQSQYAKAAELHEQALGHSRGAGNRANEIAGLASLGMTRLQMSEYGPAQCLLLESIRMSGELAERLRTHGSEEEIRQLHAGEARSHSHLSEAFAALGQYDDAIAHAEAGLELVRDVGDKRTECHLLGRLAEALERVGQYDSAIERARAALSLATHNADRVGEAENLARLGGLMLHKDAHAQARDYLSRGLDVAKGLGKQGAQLTASISTSLALVSIDVSDDAEGISARFDGALQAGKQIGNRALEAAAHMQRGRALYKSGQLDAALEAHQQAATINQDTRDFHTLAVNYSDIAYAYVRKGEHHEAIRYFKGSLAAFDHVWKDLTTDERRVDFGDTFDMVSRALQKQLLLISAKEQPSGIEALEYAEHGRSRALERLLAQQRMDARKTVASAEGAFPSDGRLSIADMVGYAQRRRVTILVYSVLSPTAVASWTLDPTGAKPRLDVKMNSIDETDGSVAQLVERTRRAIGADRPDSLEYARPGSPTSAASASTTPASATALLQRCYELLVAPLRLTPGQPLLLVPDSELFALPFAALQDPNGRHLIESHSIRVVPSIGTAIELEGRAAARARVPSEPTALVVGDPNFHGWAEQLKHAKKEAKQIHGALDASDAYEDRAKRMIADEATKEAVMATMPSCDLIHLATHSEPSGILLGGATRELGTLSMAEVQAIELRARLVVLSGCDSFRGRLSDSAGVVGISRAFISAGALELVASLWKVDDLPTCDLMKRFYEALLSDEVTMGADAWADSAAAMQKVMVELIRKGERTVAQWASFVVYGVGSELPSPHHVEAPSSPGPEVAAPAKAAKLPPKLALIDAIAGSDARVLEEALQAASAAGVDDALLTEGVQRLSLLASPPPAPPCTPPASSGQRGGDEEDDVHFAVTGPAYVEMQARVFNLRVWAVVEAYVERFGKRLEELQRQGDMEHRRHDFETLGIDVRELTVHVHVESCRVEPQVEKIRWNRKMRNSSHDVIVPRDFVGDFFRCSVAITVAEAPRPCFDEDFIIERRASSGAFTNQIEQLLCADAKLSARIDAVEMTATLAMHRHGVHPDQYPAIQRASVRIGLLNCTSGRLCELGSGTIIDGGGGTPRNQVLTAAHLFVDPKSRKPNWQSSASYEAGESASIDWLDAASPFIIAIGMYEAIDQPSRWQYWAQLVTPVPVLQELAEHPDAPHDKSCLLDLAVLRIRGRLDMIPNVYQHFFTDKYVVNAKHVADDALASDNSPLPRGVPLGVPAELDTADVLTVFGWFSPIRNPHGRSPDTLHAPESKPIMNISQGYLISEVRLDTAGSGGATCDCHGRLVAVNSFTLARSENKRTCLRAVSRLRPEHGLVRGAGATTPETTEVP